MTRPLLYAAVLLLLLVALVTVLVLTGDDCDWGGYYDRLVCEGKAQIRS